MYYSRETTNGGIMYTKNEVRLIRTSTSLGFLAGSLVMASLGYVLRQIVKVRNEIKQ